MSQGYYDDSYRPSGRRVSIQSHQSPDSSSRRDISSTSRNFASQSTFQPIRQRNPPYDDRHYPEEYPNSTRSTSDRTNNLSNNESHRRYRLEAPSTHSHVRHPQSYRNGQDYPRYERNPDQYDRRHHREETHPSTSYPLHSNHQSVDVLSPRQHSNPIRSFDHSSSSIHTLPIHQPSDTLMPMQLHHPTSLLSQFLQSFFDGHSPSLNNDDDHSPSVPINLITFARMMQRPDAHTLPVAFHVQFSDLFDLFAHDETPSVGLSDSDIERMPTMIYRKTSKSKSTDDKCAICLSQYKTGETVKYLRCKHFFHPECIDPWLKTSIQCPICRGAQSD